MARPFPHFPSRSILLILFCILSKVNLRSVIDQGQFYSLSFNGILRLIHAEYPSELEGLKTAYSILVQTKPRASESSSSQIRYRGGYDEVNRTLVSLLMLRKIHHKDYIGFVGNQQDWRPTPPRVVVGLDPVSIPA
ncbi:hypothetical protein BBP40_009185 [Aspergillus hancockii]|nr:hypothetical protein BBP40_009185 [Aspergillus hancockii]